MTADKYSILMSLYWKEKPEYLTQAIDSMLSQTVQSDEIVIVKDGPLTEALEAVLQSFGSRITIVTSDVNIGLGKALNLGLSHCKNELVARMDTDDIAKPDRCEKQLNKFAAKPELAIVGSWVDEFHNTTSDIISVRKVPCSHDDIYNYAKRRSAFNHPAVMYRKTAVEANGGYSDMRRNQDVDLFGRMLFAGCRAENIDESLLWFRSNDDLAKRRRSWENSMSYIDTIHKFWKMGYSTYLDYVTVAVAQTGMFLMPVRLQHWVYNKFLRK